MSTPYSFYQALDANKQEIRLLEIISPSSPASSPIVPLESVQCRLHTVSLLHKPTFTALSYVWGDATEREDITVNGVAFPATLNLASALKYVRAHWQNQFPGRDVSTFRIWADAVCINQTDLDERSQQVQLMGQIYSEAEIVFSWLGQ
ncbi:heterokaryon incompatibility protein-domain-containing protein, partial [Lophiotrema nucula]